MSDTRDKAAEMVAGAMGYVLAKLSEDPDWIRRLSEAGAPNLEVALRDDAETFMHYRGRFILDDIVAVAARPLPDRMQIADEVSGIVVGSGYYSAPIGIDAALEVADAVLSLFTPDTTEENPNG